MRLARFVFELLALVIGCIAAATPALVAQARATRAATPPVIDGRETDAVWRSAAPTSAFREYQPRENAEPQQRTEFKIVYDDRYLYVFVRAFDSHPDSIGHAVTRRDVRGSSDQIGVLIDSNHDGRTGFEFWVNPDGVKRDYAIYDDATEDVSWDALWDVATRVDSLGWAAEFRIPFSQLRFRGGASPIFGLLVWRTIERTQESVTWPLAHANRAGVSSQFGELVGITGVGGHHELAVAPYAVAKNVSEKAAAGYDRDQQQSLGVDLTYGVTSSLMLDATVNPDFGQVEADPSLLNLTALETFLPEQRPFFTEGAGLYQFDLNCNDVNCANEGLFYSRRIGRAPQLEDSYGDANSPPATSIAAAAKLTGRLPNGLMLGALDAVTDRVAGTSRRTIEPGTNYAVLRAQQDVGGDRSTMGVMVTAVNRALDAWTRDSLRQSAYVAATDFHTYFDGGQYKLSASLSGSRVSGTPASITATQLDAVHEYQRPGGALRVDSTRTRLTGDAEELLVGKYGGGITRFQTSYERQSPGFEPNDIGFLQRADEQSWSTWAGLIFNKPTRFTRSWRINGNEWNTWTASGLLLERAVNFNAHALLANNWLVEGGSTLDQLSGSACDRCARGGPALRLSPRRTSWFQLTGDERLGVVPVLAVNWQSGDDGRSHAVIVTPTISVHPVNQLQASIGLSVSRNVDNTQWFANVVDSAGALHYAFAHLAQHTVAVTVQASYAAQRNLTVEVYAEPFASSGTYSNVRELSATPDAASYDARFLPYAPPPTSSTRFNFLQLQTSLVVRWEYRVGSTLFLVWTHDRTGTDAGDPNRSWSDEYHDLFSLHPQNTVLLKAAYTISR
ncbi:MAG TPA: DUF5916 domain-containing protein [Gemmatimonadaceae bacterium]